MTPPCLRASARLKRSKPSRFDATACQASRSIGTSCFAPDAICRSIGDPNAVARGQAVEEFAPPRTPGAHDRHHVSRLDPSRLDLLLVPTVHPIDEVAIPRGARVEV